ncbi:MAG: DUF4932 domain-containing protein [Firmicutes bacterium]|nr:DUF4932 domain-containing protein [Bacillota bacterium]
MENINMVDERFELLSLVFRLAGNPNYVAKKTAYQRELSKTFAGYKEHPAVVCVRGFFNECGQAFHYAMHLAKEGGMFRLISTVSTQEASCAAQFPNEKALWNRDIANAFLPLLNNFYADTQFGVFFKAHAMFYEKATARFVRKLYRHVDLEWFRKYEDPALLRCFFNPSASYGNYGIPADGKACAAICMNGSLGTIVHEFCHPFANPIAEAWYAQDPAFKKLCDGSTGEKSIRAGYSTNGLTMACEYVTRAYTILYHVQHGHRLSPLLRAEKAIAFPYIEEVYAMIQP